MTKGVAVKIHLLSLGLCVVGSQITACGGGEEVLLGRAALGSPAQTPASEPEKPSLPSPLPKPVSLVEVAEDLQCDDAAERPLVVDLRSDEFSIYKQQCPDPLMPGTCRNLYSVEKLVPLADGSVWVVGLGTPVPVHAVHIGEHGELLGTVELASPLISSTVDDHGVAWIVTGGELGTNIQRFSSTGGELAAPHSEVSHAAAIAALPEHGVLVASSDGQEHVDVTLLDYEGQSVWSHKVDTDSLWLGLTVGPSQFALLSSIRREPAYMGIVAHRFTFAGELVRKDESHVNLVTPGWTYYSASGLDAQSNLILAAAPPDPVHGSDIGFTLDVETIDASDASRSAVRVTGTTATTFTLAADGQLWFADFDLGPTPPPPGEESARLIRISPDGTLCERFQYEGDNFVSMLAAAPDGRLWFVDPHGVGRLAAPASR